MITLHHQGAGPFLSGETRPSGQYLLAECTPSGWHCMQFTHSVLRAPLRLQGEPRQRGHTASEQHGQARDVRGVA